LLKKNVPFVWTEQAEIAFQQLKSALVQAPVLAIPDFSKQFVLETDASDVGFGAVLMQEGHPVAYLSKAVCAKNRSLSTYEKECMAIIMAVEKWRPYLQHKLFVIKTDHRSLLHLSDQRITTKLQEKALFKLMDLQFQIVYRSGSTNLAADALSRCPAPHAILAVSSCHPEWIDRVKQGYTEDAEAQRLFKLWNEAGQLPPAYSIKDGLIRFKGRVWLGSNSLAHNHVIQAFHDSGVGGHSGFHATYYRLRQLFSWPKMKEDIMKFIKGCSVCQQAKVEHVSLPGKLQPLPIPTQAWQIITMDFIEGLPKSQRYDVILVVVDKFTKYAHFVPLSHPFTASKVAEVYVDHIYKLHGLPTAIISDRDKIFTSQFWKELFRMTDTQLLMSSSYHPQTDGQTERVNQCVETFLRCSVHACPRQWSKWLSLAEFWYNTSYHSALGRSPFEALYGHSPKHFGISSDQQLHSEDLEQWLTERNLLNDLLQHHLHRAQQRMKHQADKHRSEREFAVGDMVYLRLQPYIQSSVAPRSNQKLSFRFFGPFQIVARVGAVAYKLNLPDECRIHPVVHVSQLKRFVPPTTVVESDLSALPADPEEAVFPIQLLSSRMIQKGASSITQVKVHWTSLPSSLATWEELHDLRRRFPACAAWGQAAFQGGRNVSNQKATRATSIGG
jgi:hypothetical protein